MHDRLSTVPHTRPHLTPHSVIDAFIDMTSTPCFRLVFWTYIIVPLHDWYACHLRRAQETFLHEMDSAGTVHIGTLQMVYRM